MTAAHEATARGAAAPAGGNWPTVGVVLPTHNRPALMRRALAAILGQDYPGPMRVLVVYDRAEPDLTLATGGVRPVSVITNTRTPGLSGARNTGILAMETEFVAFCDDDDAWAPEK